MNPDDVVLITGGTGSFGQAMAEYLLRRGCSEIRIFSRDEEKQHRMRTSVKDERLRFYIGDVRDPDGLAKVCRGVTHVFHAAALKQVPTSEFFPMQAVMTNVIGSANVLDACIEAGVESVVCLSTDKAVYPVNAMGMTKALMEKVVQSVVAMGAERGTRVSVVRYGNVMYSRGSVIPLMVDQIAAGGPVTITEPSMTRFFLPLPAAVSLVEFALWNSQPGDICIRRAPASTIGTLAEVLMDLFRRRVEMVRLGMRHGEKLHETLASKEEMRRAEDHGDFLRIPVDARNLNYDLYFTEGDPEELFTEDYTSANAEQLTEEGLRDLLLTLPEIQARLREVGVEVG